MTVSSRMGTRRGCGIVRILLCGGIFTDCLGCVCGYLQTFHELRGLRGIAANPKHTPSDCKCSEILLKYIRRSSMISGFRVPMPHKPPFVRVVRVIC